MTELEVIIAWVTNGVLFAVAILLALLDQSIDKKGRFRATTLAPIWIPLSLASIIALVSQAAIFIINPLRDGYFDKKSLDAERANIKEDREALENELEVLEASRTQFNTEKSELQQRQQELTKWFKAEEDRQELEASLHELLVAQHGIQRSQCIDGGEGPHIDDRPLVLDGDLEQLFRDYATARSFKARRYARRQVETRCEDDMAQACTWLGSHSRRDTAVIRMYEGCILGDDMGCARLSDYYVFRRHMRRRDDLASRIKAIADQN